MLQYLTQTNIEAILAACDSAGSSGVSCTTPTTSGVMTWSTLCHGRRRKNCWR